MISQCSQCSEGVRQICTVGEWLCHLLQCLDDQRWLSMILSMAFIGLGYWSEVAGLPDVNSLWYCNRTGRYVICLIVEWSGMVYGGYN